jgi:hypothetical protein
MNKKKKENTCITCGVIIEDGLTHCDKCRNKYRT